MHFYRPFGIKHRHLPNFKRVFILFLQSQESLANAFSRLNPSASEFVPNFSSAQAPTSAPHYPTHSSSTNHHNNSHNNRHYNNNTNYSNNHQPNNYKNKNGNWSHNSHPSNQRQNPNDVDPIELEARVSLLLKNGKFSL